MAELSSRPKERAESRDSEPRSPGKLRWVLGWIVLPGSLLAALFLSGVHVGARRPDQGLARLLLKAFGAKPGVAVVETKPEPLEPRPGAKPGEPFSLSEVLSEKQLQAIADKTLGLGVADLECTHVCRAYARAEYDVDVYAIELCELGRAGSWAPSMLVCRGQLEAQPSKRIDGDANEQPAK
jgi:hypothetical protein